MASRLACEAGDTRAPGLVPQSPPNFLDVRLPEHGLRIIGLRIPMFRRHEGQEEREYWQWLVSGATQWASEPTLIVGDLNVDPCRRSWRAAELRRFELSGWHLADPSGAWSYWASDTRHSRIDHAVATTGVTIHSAVYRPQVGSILLAGPGERALSDHAALDVLVTVDV